MMNASSAIPVEPRPVDEGSFRKFAASFPTGVAVVTTRDAAGGFLGVTMNALTPLSLAPPTYVMCLANTSRTLPALLHSAVFCINFLAEHQASISALFASKADDKFARLRFSVAENGTPLIAGVTAACEGRVVRTLDGGDHVIVLGALDKVHIGDANPLVLCRGRYAGLPGVAE